MGNCTRKGIFTFKTPGWHGMPVLAFSAMMSLISITFAQFNMYKTRHEFDMTKLGKLLYLSSALLLVFAKLCGQIMIFTAVYTWILSKEMNPYLELFILQLPFLIIQILIIHETEDINLLTLSP